MEIEVMGLDGNTGSGNGYGSVSGEGEISRQKWASRRYEGSTVKQEGFGFCGDAWRTTKVAKNDADFSPASTGLLLENSYGGLLDKSTSAAAPALPVSSHKLSVSCNSKPESSALPYFQHMAGSHTKNAGYYYSGGMNASTGMYLLSGVGGPFTQSQWLELEQQALIYKYMKENEPVPLHLLIPIIKAFESAGWFGFNAGTFRPTSWGMGPFHLGYSNSTDPEPGRCRRTDGKKWRCARDAVASQKYCERHMNRGRHRSRKHVEGQGNGNGHSASGATQSSAEKLIPPSVAASSAEPLVLQGHCPSSTFDINQNHDHFQVKSSQSFASNPNTNAFVDRMQVNGEKSCQGLQDATQPAFLSPSMGLNCSESSFSLTKQQFSCAESTLNVSSVPSQSLFEAGLWKAYGSSAYNPADFMSSTSSQTDERAAVPSLRLPRGLEKGESHDQGNWAPISYGPLGEALQGTGESRKTSAFNMLPKGWEYGTRSCQLSSSSPTGVLQKSALACLSNSSAGSSPRADNSKTI